MNRIKSSEMSYPDFPIEDLSSHVGSPTSSISQQERSRRYSSPSTDHTDLETLSFDSPLSSHGEHTPLSEHSIQSLNSSHDQDEEQSTGITVPETLESDDEKTYPPAITEKQLGELRKKYAVTEKLLDDSLAHYPEVKKYLEKSEAVSFENIFNFLYSQSSREKAAERLEGRKELTKESLLFICELQKKLNILTVQIKLTELKKEYSETKAALDSLTTQDPEAQQQHSNLEQKLDNLETEIEKLEPEDAEGIWREVSDEEAKRRYGTNEISNA